jgi:UDP-N-acetylglucosamine 4,6-dehydratase
VPYFKKLISEGSKTLPITHVEMTRFWITLQQGVDFVLKNFTRMQGGEIFIPKIPSVRITDLATSLNSEISQEFVGIRPGEKLHEIMCSRDDAHLTLEFEDHYVICPSITFHGMKHDYKVNMQKEVGQPAAEGFEYNSGTNEDFLTIEKIQEYDKLAEL